MRLCASVMEINAQVSKMFPAFITIFLFKSSELYTISFFDTGTMKTFDARHIELFATEEYRGGRCIFRGYGKEQMIVEAAGFTTSAAIFDSSHMMDDASLEVFDNGPSWEGVEYKVTPNGVGVKAYIGEIHNGGSFVFFYDKMEIGDEVFSVRVSFVT